MRRKRHSPEQIIAKLREADALLAGGPDMRFSTGERIKLHSPK